MFLSDHDEAFLEHGSFKHGTNVNIEVLHVPLVVKWPSSVRGFLSTVTDPVSLLDLVPTLVDGLSLPSGERGFQGRSLIPAAFEGDQSDRPRYAVTRGVVLRPEFPPRTRFMFESGRWRILHNPLTNSNELYRSHRDPLEKNNLAFEQPLQTLLLRQSLLIQSAWNERLIQRGDAEEAVEALAPEVVEQLEALGYVN